MINSHIFPLPPSPHPYIFKVDDAVLLKSLGYITLQKCVDKVTNRIVWTRSWLCQTEDPQILCILRDKEGLSSGD